MTRWATLINSIVEKDPNYDLEFFISASNSDFNNFKKVIGIELSKQLFSLLNETNGIRNRRFGDYVVFPIPEIIRYTINFRDYLVNAKIEQDDDYLFFSDNGCGEHFGYKISNNQILDERVWI